MRPQRSVATRWAVVYFAGSTATLISPLYFAWGNRIHPRVVGLPWSLVAVLLVIALNFLVLAWLYWRRLVDDEESP